MAESLLDAYLERELELITKRLDTWNDKMLEEYKVKILPLICDQRHINFYVPIVNEEEANYMNCV